MSLGRVRARPRRQLSLRARSLGLRNEVGEEAVVVAEGLLEPLVRRRHTPGGPRRALLEGGGLLELSEILPMPPGFWSAEHGDRSWGKSG